MPWRDPSPLYPEVDTERGAGSISPPASVPLGADPSLIGTPAAAACAPIAAAAPPSACSAFGCTVPITSRLTGMCDAHGERYLTDLREYTDAIGRGTFEP